jgi:K+-transporting ATPase KdpF subunit
LACSAFTPWQRIACSGAAMTEPVLGLIVALALGAYLLVTLLRPERF